MSPSDKAVMVVVKKAQKPTKKGPLEREQKGRRQKVVRGGMSQL